MGPLFQESKMYVIYTQNMCGYCSLAKELLDERSIKYTEIPIDVDADAKNFVKSFERMI